MQQPDDEYPDQRQEEPEDPPIVEVPNMIDDTFSEVLQLKEEVLELLGEVQHMPLKEYVKLPGLKNDKTKKGVVRTADTIIKVLSLADPDLTISNRLH